MKTARRLLGSLIAATALLSASVEAQAETVVTRLNFNPANACNAGPCVTNPDMSQTSTIKSGYGNVASSLSVTMLSDLSSGGTGPMYFWDTGIGLNNFAVGGDPAGGGGGLIFFTVLPPATTVTLKSFDFGSFPSSAAPSSSGGQPQAAYAASYNWWALYSINNMLPGQELARSWMQAGDPGAPITTGTTVHIELNGGLGFSDAVGLALKWGNSAELSTFTGMDNLTYSVTTSVPEAETIQLVGCGLAVMAWAGRRRSQRGKAV